MYIPSYYKNEDPAEIEAFLKANAFGILISSVDGRPWATHIPIEFSKTNDGKAFLTGHISNQNQQRESFLADEEVLAVFTGPHAYVSSSWYDFEGVPTWNYSAVHVYGSLRVLTETELIESLKTLVDKYESGREHPTELEKLSPKTMMMTRAITGFEIEINDIQAVRKFSQNRDDANYKSVVAHLEQEGTFGAREVAREMKRLRNLE